MASRPVAEAAVSQRVVGYEGEGRHRRPLFANEGPAAPGASDGLASLGRLSALTSTDLDDGAGRRLERRQITEAEIAARARVRLSPVEPASPTDRGTAMPSVVEDSAGGDPDPLSPDPPRTEPLDTSLAVLLDATKAAVEAWQEVDASEHLLDQARIRWGQARAALDAAYRALNDPPAAIADSEHTSVPSRTPSSTNSSPPGSRAKRRTVLSPNQQRVLDATERHAGELKAVAAELGFKHYQSVTSCLHDIGRKGLLPADLIPKLPASFARFGVPS